MRTDEFFIVLAILCLFTSSAVIVAGYVSSNPNIVMLGIILFISTFIFTMLSEEFEEPVEGLIDTVEWYNEHITVKLQAKFTTYNSQYGRVEYLCIVEYKPRKRIIKPGALPRYLRKYEEEIWSEYTQEKLCEKIYKDLHAALAPRKLKVILIGKYGDTEVETTIH